VCDVMDDASEEMNGISLFFSRKFFSRRRTLPTRVVQPRWQDKPFPFRVDGNGPAGIRVHVCDGFFPILIELQDIALVILRDQQASIVGTDNAVRNIARRLPDCFPLLSRGDNTRDFCYLVFPRSLLSRRGCALSWRRTASLPALRRRRLAGAASARRRRILAGRDQSLISGILRRLHARPLPLPLRRRLAQRGQRAKDSECYRQ